MSTSAGNIPFLTRRELADFLTSQGFKISKSTLDKMAMPSAASGPPSEGRWGNRDLYQADRALAWARKRFKENRRAANS